MQDLIENKCIKRRKGVIGSELGKILILYIDDLSIPKKEDTGVQPCLEIIRQVIDNKGFYNSKDV